MKHFTLFALLLAGLAATAQEVPLATGDYSRISIPKFGNIEINFGDTPQLKSLTGGVEIILRSDKPDAKDLPIKASSIRFSYAAGSSSPSKIVMEGNVYIDHPQATVKAQKADWDFDKGTLVFSGSPIVTSALVKEMQAETVTIDFNNNTIQATNGRVPEYQLNSPVSTGGGAAPAGGLSEGSIGNWPGFLDALKSQAKADGASPGKQIVAQLKKDQQNQLLNTNTDALVANKGVIVKLLNSVLKSPALYNEAAWKSIALTDEVKALLTKEKRSPEEQVQLNRLLLQAAYPDFIKG